MDSMLENLKALAAGYVAGPETPTAVPRLTIWSSYHKTTSTPAMFHAAVYVLLQGAKRLTIGSRSFDCAASSYSVQSLGLPFTGQVIEASREKPYLGVQLKIDASIVSGLLLGMPEEDQPDIPSVAIAPATDDIVEPFYRLLRLCSSPKDIPVLAPLIECELYYRLLQGPMGNTLRQAAQARTRFSQIKKAVEWICNNATSAMSVDELAATVNMSPTSFHRHFKTVTGLSPLAYQRHVRLLDARRLMNAEAASVTAAAYAVGYASSSQFSREYTRMFGRPPIRDTLRSRQTTRNASQLRSRPDGKEN